MVRPRQAEVGWSNLPPPVSRRPVLILTRTPAIAILSNVTVAPLTRTTRGIPSEVALTPTDGVPTACVVSLENITTIPKSMLDKKITTLSRNRTRDVFRAIRHVFAMD